ncbi:MAG: MFS transporter [Acidobacteria bacterium]|nr:MFS transporter [Acidobacteriota bacterium]MCA1638927.1 MFS transporter [Acidobacteriota bacterium]
MNQTATRNSSFFYGWIIVGISTLALLISNGLSIGGIPVFYKPIQEDLLRLGTVTAQTKDSVTGLGAGLTFLLAGIFSLVVGLLIQKYSLKMLMLIGSVILGGGLAFYSQATAPWQVYLSHSLLGLSLGLVGVMVQTVLIANWFRRKRGLAMGIILTGTSFGGVLIPIVARPLIESYGWRAALLMVSSIVWLILIPAVLFLVKNKPSDVGASFDGDSLNAECELRNADFVEKDNRAKNPKPEYGLTLGEAVKTPAFWILSLCAAAIFYPIFATSQQFILHIQSPRIGATAAQAATAQSLLFVTSVGGKFLFGFLSDKLPTVRVMLICCGVMFLATLILLGFLTANTIFWFLLPFGLGYGGTFVLIQLLAVEFFGLRDIGKILGALTVIETFGGFVGSVITGRLASAAGGDYTTAFYGITMAAGLSLVCVVALNFFAPRTEVKTLNS